MHSATLGAAGQRAWYLLSADAYPELPPGGLAWLVMVRRGLPVLLLLLLCVCLCGGGCVPV